MLNKNQELAAAHLNGPLLCVAGPGSGKTTVIMHRLKRLVENHHVEPSSILVVTFTKDAAGQMRDRYAKLTGRDDPIAFSTIHSFCFSVIREEMRILSSDVMGESDKRAIIKKYIIDETITEPNDVDEKITAISNAISEVKVKKLDPNGPLFNPKSLRKSDFVGAYNRYEELKKEQGKVDFDDMILLCQDIFSKNEEIAKKYQERYQYIMVDEFQDTDNVQADVLYTLAKPKNNLFVVGDDDQSIYKFRGAEPEVMLDFPNRFKNAKTIYLDTNYRSMKTIIERAKTLIEHNQNRFFKNLHGNKNDVGEVRVVASNNPYRSYESLAKHILATSYDDLDELAVLCRTNKEVSTVAGIFSDAGIPFQTTETIQNIHSEFIYRDMISYIKIALNKESIEDYSSIANKPKRYLSKNLFANMNGDFSFSKMLMENEKNTDTKKRHMGKRNIISFRESIQLVRHQVDRKPVDFIKFIMNTIGYKEYIKEYCEYAYIDGDRVDEILNFMTTEAENYNSLYEWYGYIVRHDRIFKENMKKMREEKYGVVITTMHRSKGLEWDHVFVMNLSKGNIPFEKKNRDTDFEEERRLLYVAVTRARTSCSLYCIQKDEQSETSMFLSELMSDSPVVKNKKKSG